MIEPTDESLKVLNVGWGHPPIIGGGPIYYVQNLCLHQHVAGIQSSCFVAGTSREMSQSAPSLEQRQYDGVTYYVVENRPAYYFDWANPFRETENREIEALFSQVLQEVKPDIVHFHNLVGLSMSLVEVAKCFGLPTIMSAHNYWMLCTRDDLFAPNEEVCAGPRDGARCASCVSNASKVADFMHRASRARNILTHSVDLILAVSEKVREILIDFGVPEDKIIVQHIGSAAAEGIWRRVGSAKAKTRLSPGAVRFGYFGTIMVRKGPHIIIEAVKHLESLKGKFVIEMYGAGLFHEYKARIENLLGLAPVFREAIHFKGRYTQSDLPGLLQNIDVAIIPPVWEDNGPQTVMEALGAGVPVIGSCIGGIPDFVVSGKNGLLFRPGDPVDLALAMRRLIEDKAMIEDLKKGITEPLTMSSHVSELLTVYRQLLDRQKQEKMIRQKNGLITNLAIIAFKEGDTCTAESYFRKALECFSRATTTRHQYALMLQSAERADEAIVQLEELLAIDPNHVEAHNDIGVLYCHGGQKERALCHLLRAIALDESHRTARENLADIYLELGHTEEALLVYQNMLSNNPNDANTLLSLGNICFGLGRNEEAAFFWKKVLQLDPHNVVAGEYLQSV